jgi:hypothetical protein
MLAKKYNSKHTQTKLTHCSKRAMTNENFLPLDQKNTKPILESAEQSYIKNNFELHDYLDYEEKAFFIKI